MGETYCEPIKCQKKETCNHYLVKNNAFGKSMAEDLSDICQGERLYIEGKKFLGFPNKKYYEELISFYDNVCKCEQSEQCDCREIYRKYDRIKNPFSSSKSDCKMGDEYTCKHAKHPDNRMLTDAFEFIEAENEAFIIADKKEGTISFVCPICGGNAIGRRQKISGRISGLGSHCEKCGFGHT